MPITRPEVHSLLADFRANGFPALMARLAPDATWTIANSAYPMHGVHLFGTRSKREMELFMQERYFPMYDGLPRLTVDSVTVMDNRAVVEVHVVGPLKTGRIFDNRYAWFFDFDEDTKKIVAVRDYLDTLLVYNSMLANEKLQQQEQKQHSQ
ncbi:hypothetical protein CALCODRAFT_484128 [Calocera cornea HHB12733]|uniref:SnoaL-like domain-containing protein n=1 Tax=Calocera cornea HHB12733 TaxID=1353952 RepID=A0A165F5D8_9BASI|nr:hypothetical protein CALCODRAFT_484128 [Calocera cornea HHB12733]